MAKRGQKRIRAIWGSGGPVRCTPVVTPTGETRFTHGPTGKAGCLWDVRAHVPHKVAVKAALKNYSSPVCVHPVHAPIHACPPPAGACIVLPRAAPQSMRPREPREPDTAEDAGGQTDHLGQAYRGGLRRNLFFHKPPSFMNSLNPLFFSTLKSLFGRRVRSWLRTNAGGAPNTCKSRG